MGFIFAGIAALIVGGFVTWLWGAVFWKAILVSWASSHPFFLALLVVVILAGVAIWLADRDSYVSSSTSGKSFLFGGLAVVALLGVIAIPFFQTYQIQQARLHASEVTTEESDFDYDQRVPHGIAVNQVNQNMQDSTGSYQRVRSMAESGEFGKWNTLVVRAGWFQGYESVLSIDSPSYGNVSAANIERCYFAESAQLRLGGSMPHNSLDRAVLESVLFQRVTMHDEDAYAYCDGDTPVVVMPLVEVRGFFDTHSVPYGVATYNGATGVLDVTRDVEEIAEIPGPTYPITIASDQRNSMQANGDWGAHIQHQLGWDVTGGPELQLRVADSGETQYVTALDPRGSSTSVTAMSVVAAQGFTPGQLNPITIYQRDQSRAADSVVVDSVFNQYSWMTEFASDRYQIYEIVPGTDGGWVASVGTDQSVVYRVIINADATELVLVDEDGNEVTRGNVPSVDEEGGEGTPTTGAGSGLDLSGLSDEQLVDVIQEAAEILANR